MTTLEVTSRKIDLDMALIKLKGSAELFTSDRLKAEIFDLVDEGVRVLVFDLTELEFLDSAGMGALIAAYRRVRPVGGSVRLLSPSGYVARLLEMLEIDKILPIYYSESLALKPLDKTEPEELSAAQPAGQ